jgi:DNA repair exonuclease SbcCD ATPase subunit
MINNFDSLYNKAIQIKSKYETLEVQHKDKLNQKAKYLDDMVEKQKSQNLYEKSISYMKEIIDVLSRSHIEHLSTLLNSAVQTIFFDRNYSISLEISEFRNSNCLTIYLIEEKDGVVLKTDIKDNGFGVKTIVGFVLQVYFILYHKLSPILFIDEGFSALSSQYIPNLKSLLDSLRDTYGFTFVLIAHDIRFIDIADRLYEVKNGEVKLING